MGEICWQALCTTSIFSLACAAIPLTVHLLPCYQYYEAEVQLRRIHLLRLSEKPWRSLHRSTPGRLRGVFRPISPALHQPYSPPEYCLYPFSDSLYAKPGVRRRLLDGVEASILHLSLVGFALPLCLSQSYDLVPGAPTSGVIPSNNPAHQEIYQTCVMIDPIL